MPNQAVKIILSPSSGTVELGENQIQLTASLVDAYGSPVEPKSELSWVSSNPSLATVDSSGLVTSAAIVDANALLQGGQCSVTVSYPRNVSEKIEAVCVLTISVPQSYSGVVAKIVGNAAAFGDTKVYASDPWANGQPVIGGS
jgi:uncharacterized protein YjdB